MEEHADRAEARPNAVCRHSSTVLMMHDTVDSEPHQVVEEEPGVAHVLTEADVVGGVESVSRKTHQHRCLHDVSVEPFLVLVLPFVALVDIQIRSDVVDLGVVVRCPGVLTCNVNESHAYTMSRMSLLIRGVFMEEVRLRLVCALGKVYR